MAKTTGNHHQWGRIIVVDVQRIYFFAEVTRSFPLAGIGADRYCAATQAWILNDRLPFDPMTLGMTP
jgi:hypothetical protein